MRLNKVLLNQKKFFLSPVSLYDYDDTEYQGIRDVVNLFNGIAFNQSTDEDYYKPGWIKSTFNGNYIEYESKGDKNKNLLQGEYLDIIRSYLSDLIIDYKTQGKQKIQLTMSINFISSNDSDEAGNLGTKSDNIETMMGDETDETIDELIEFFSQNYPKDLEESVRESDFIFDSVNLFIYLFIYFISKRHKDTI